MPHDDAVYIAHILELARKAISKLHGKRREDFDGNEDLRLALAHLVQTIGEAARRISPEGRERIRVVPWHRVIGMRHRIVHDYMDVDYDILWQVVTENLPELIELLSPFDSR